MKKFSSLKLAMNENSEEEFLLNTEAFIRDNEDWLNSTITSVGWTEENLAALIEVNSTWSITQYPLFYHYQFTNRTGQQARIYLLSYKSGTSYASVLLRCSSNEMREK